MFQGTGGFPLERWRVHVEPERGGPGSEQVQRRAPAAVGRLIPVLAVIVNVTLTATGFPPSSTLWLLR